MILDTTEIQRILPHRYPFLMVDAIEEMERVKRIVGIKNVTINESYFQGHFPGKPIMPGVLIIEAMAQTGGLLLLMEVSEREREKKLLMCELAAEAILMCKMVDREDLEQPKTAEKMSAPSGLRD